MTGRGSGSVRAATPKISGSCAAARGRGSTSRLRVQGPCWCDRKGIPATCPFGSCGKPDRPCPMSRGWARGRPRRPTGGRPPRPDRSAMVLRGASNRRQSAHQSALSCRIALLPMSERRSEPLGHGVDAVSTRGSGFAECPFNAIPVGFPPRPPRRRVSRHRADRRPGKHSHRRFALGCPCPSDAEAAGQIAAERRLSLTVRGGRPPITPPRPEATAPAHV